MVQQGRKKKYLFWLDECAFTFRGLTVKVQIQTKIALFPHKNILKLIFFFSPNVNILSTFLQKIQTKFTKKKKKKEKKPVGFLTKSTEFCLKRHEWGFLDIVHSWALSRDASLSMDQHKETQHEEDRILANRNTRNVVNSTLAIQSFRTICKDNQF